MAPCRMGKLNNYHKQDMFGQPGPLPQTQDGEADINVLPFLWNYLTKVGGRCKARRVCNGSPRNKGSVTLANTYAACLEQPAARMFWSLAALENKLVFGADAANAFAEAPPPVAPLYLKVDEQFFDWWTNCLGKEPLDPHSYVKVQHAMQ